MRRARGRAGARQERDELSGRRALMAGHAKAPSRLVRVLLVSGRRIVARATPCRRAALRAGACEVLGPEHGGGRVGRRHHLRLAADSKIPLLPDSWYRGASCHTRPVRGCLGLDRVLLGGSGRAAQASAVRVKLGGCVMPPLWRSARGSPACGGACAGQDDLTALATIFSFCGFQSAARMKVVCAASPPPHVAHRVGSPGHCGQTSPPSCPLVPPPRRPHMKPHEPS